MTRDSLIHGIAGATGGTFSAILCAPLDTSRTRMQIDSSIAKRGLIVSLRSTFQSEGIKGWYRGLSASLLTVPTSYGIYFPVYDFVKSRRIFENTHVNNAVSSLGAGMTAEIFTNPFWVVRTRLQTHHVHFTSSARAVTLSETFREIAAKEGYGAFYKGFGATLLGLSQISILMPLYEVLKSDTLCGDSTFGIIVASSVAKVVAMTLTYPIEVIRTRLQDQRAIGSERKYKGILSTLQLILKEEGPRALYAGITANFSRVVPNTAAALLGYEWTVSLLTSL